MILKSLSFTGFKSFSEKTSVQLSEHLNVIVGPNGSGKSTLFNCINGFHQPQKGKIQYRGQSLTKCQPHEVVKLGISRTFQNLQNVPYMTVLNNILIGAHQRITLKETLYRWLTTEQRERDTRKV